MYFDKMYQLNPADFKLLGYAIVLADFIDIENRSDYDNDVIMCNDTGRCQHCNKRIKHHVAIENTANGDVIAVGFDCYNETFVHGSTRELNLHRARKAADRKWENAVKRQAVRDFRQQHVSFFDMLDNYTGRNNFVEDIRQKSQVYILSDKQMDAVKAAIAKEEEWKESQPKLVAAPTGKIAFSGFVKSIKWVENRYGGTLKMMVLTDDLYKVWVSVPSKLGQVEIGDKVEMTAYLSPSDDPTLAWGKLRA